jgi:Transposase
VKHQANRAVQSANGAGEKSRDLMVRRGIVASISRRHAARFLKKGGFQPHQFRYWLTEVPDGQREQKINEGCALYTSAVEAAKQGERTISLDEMTGVQALERLFPGLPMIAGHVLRREFEYMRHGTLSWFFNFDVVTGQVIEPSWGPTRNEADYEEIRAQGFAGSIRTVQRFVLALRDEPEQITLAPATAAERFSSNTATWLFIHDQEQLTPQKQAELELICQRSETARKTYELTQQFMSMLRLHRGQEFEAWLSAVEASHIAELCRFAHSLLKDKNAVVAGLTLSYSNGPVEAQVQKLKLVKRQMFGRAKLPLLRQRLLHAA